MRCTYVCISCCHTPSPSPHIDLNNVTCFGGMLGQFLHYYLLGFETTLINSFTYIMENTSQRGMHLHAYV